MKYDTDFKIYPLALVLALAGLVFVTIFVLIGQGELVGTVIAALVSSMIAGSVLLLACFYRPSLVLAFLIFSTLLQEVLFVDLEKVATLNQAIGFVLVWVSAMLALDRGDLGRTLLHPITLALAVLLANITLSYILLSVGQESPLQDISQFVSAFVYFFVCLLVIRREQDLIYLVGAYLAGGLVVAISGDFWNALANPLRYITSGRQGIHGVAGHYIEYSFRCLLPLPMILYMLTIRQYRWLKPGLMALGMALGIAALLSGSRGAVVSFAFMSALIVLVSHSSISKKIIFGSAFMALPFVLPIADILNNLFSIVRGNLPSDYSTMSRISLIDTLFQNLSLETVIWGAGLENFRDFYSGNFNPPHSIWLQSFFELGIIGSAIQLFIVFKLVKLFLSIYRKPCAIKFETSAKLTMGIGLSVFVILFWGFYENVGLINGSKHLFILMGAMVAGARIVGYRKGFYADTYGRP